MKTAPTSLRDWSRNSLRVAVDLNGTTYMAGRELPYQRVTISSPDENKTGVDFTVDAAGLVWGYVFSPDKEPIPQTGIMLTSGESMLSQALKMAGQRRTPVADNSGEDGYYELAGVPLNEEFRVHAMSSAYAPQLSDPFILTESNRTARVDIYMFAGTNVYGHVVDANNQAIPGAEVMCIPSYGKFFSAMTAPQAFRGGNTDSNGAFTLERTARRRISGVRPEKRIPYLPPSAIPFIRTATAI